ncbi:MAG: hypothetical protein RL136_1077 [Planctomycetota bacterium]|jgi:hypothetical protein
MGTTSRRLLDPATLRAGRLLPVLAYGALVLIAAPVSARTPRDVDRLTMAAAARPDDSLGRSVAIDGLRIAASVPEFDLPSASGAGGVAIFERVAGEWVRTALVTAFDAAVADVLGECIDLDGELLIASAANVGLLTPAPWTGAAYVFERTAGGWEQRAKLIPADPSEFMEAGLASAIDAPTRTAIVAARLDDDAGPDTGSVSVYRESKGVWTLAQELHAPDARPGDAFGYRVAIDGDVLAVSTPATDDVAESTGSVYVFERVAGAFEFRTKLMASDADYRDRFGFAVDVEGDTIAVGAVGDDNLEGGADHGAAYVFKRIGDEWTEVAKLVASDRASLDGLGSSVAIEGDRVLVGASSAAVGDIRTGAAYLFESVDGAWLEVAKFTASTAGAGDGVGASVALGGSLAVLGAQGHDFPVPNAGAVYVADVSPTCAADLDRDGTIGATDLAALLLAWGPGDASPADLDGDGFVGASDLAALLLAWGSCG